MSFENDEEIIHLANDSEYGLAASIWTRNRSRGEALAKHIRAGTVMINDVLSCFGISEAPHGGIKSSGIGRTHGRFGLEEMVRMKYVDSDRLPKMKKTWWYSYGGSFTGQVEGFLDLQFARTLKQRLQGVMKSATMVIRKGRL
jgi:succinate-semialdehyde dehydrogenase/glutarate-semialdehyde dehydrogenase